MSSERDTERFFAHGIENYGKFHGNYLNFGLWERGITDYVAASENLLTRVAKKIGLNRGAILLDVACGMGAQDLFFMKRFQCKKIEALDLTKKHITLAQNRNTFKKITYRQGNACALPYNKALFTHVTGIEGPVNFITREKFFAEAQRVLKPRGMLGMSDFCLTREPSNAIEYALVRFCAWLWHIPIENFDTAKRYRMKLERSGFTDVEIECVGDNVYKGYFTEQINYATRHALYKIRGQIIGRASLGIDFITYQLYRLGLIEYILVSARKKAETL